MFNQESAGYSLSDIAAVAGSAQNDGFGFGGNGGAWWILILFLLFGNNGWGNGMGNGNNLYPWFNQADITQAGFTQLANNNAISGIQSGINGLSTQICNGVGEIQNSLCSGFAGVNASIANGFAQSEIADNARQIANMQQAFSTQTAITGGLTSLSNQFSDCCCENRLGLANLNSTILAENCADRAAISDGIRDILVSQNANTQRILDTMCQDKIDAKNEKIADLERQLTMANLAASQGAQTSLILADNAAQTQALEQYLNPVPVPAYYVPNPRNYYGSFCGCNCGNV